jgi:hypothetical protein
MMCNPLIFLFFGSEFRNKFVASVCFGKQICSQQAAVGTGAHVHRRKLPQFISLLVLVYWLSLIRVFGKELSMTANNIILSGHGDTDLFGNLHEAAE